MITFLTVLFALTSPSHAQLKKTILITSVNNPAQMEPTQVFGKFFQTAFPDHSVVALDLNVLNPHFFPINSLAAELHYPFPSNTLITHWIIIGKADAVPNDGIQIHGIGNIYPDGPVGEVKNLIGSVRKHVSPDLKLVLAVDGVFPGDRNKQALSRALIQELGTPNATVFGLMRSSSTPRTESFQREKKEMLVQPLAGIFSALAFASSSPVLFKLEEPVLGTAVALMSAGTLALVSIDRYRRRDRYATDFGTLIQFQNGEPVSEVWANLYEDKVQIFQIPACQPLATEI